MIWSLIISRRENKEMWYSHTAFPHGRDIRQPQETLGWRSAAQWARRVDSATHKNYYLSWSWNTFHEQHTLQASSGKVAMNNRILGLEVVENKQNHNFCIYLELIEMRIHIKSESKESTTSQTHNSFRTIHILLKQCKRWVYPSQFSLALKLKGQLI